MDYPVKDTRRVDLRHWLILFAAVVGMLVTASLGRWQLSRAAQKEALQAAIEFQGRKTTVTASELRSTIETLQLVHQPARLEGRWMQGKTVYLDNRQMKARVGFFVMTPLALDGGGVILVQRGWVPRNFEDRNRLPAVETPLGLVQIEGRIAPAPSKLYAPGDAAQGAIRQNLDLPQFEIEVGTPLMPVTLQQTGPSTEGLLREWPAFNLGVDKHYGYAFQWFGLATLIGGLTVWFQIVRRYFFRTKDVNRNV